MRSRPQPISVGRDEKPKPGRDGITTSKASSARPPNAVGSVSGPIDLDLLEDRARPPVRDDQRQRVRVARTDVDEVDVDAVDRRDELRPGVQLRLGLAPVVVRAPVADELLQLGQPRALRPIGNRLPVGPAGRRDAPRGGRRGPPAAPRRGRGGWRGPAPRRCRVSVVVAMVAPFTSLVGVLVGGQHESGRPESVALRDEHDAGEDDEAAEEFAGAGDLTQPHEGDEHGDRWHEVEQRGRGGDREVGHGVAPEDESQRGRDQGEVERRCPRRRGRRDELVPAPGEERERHQRAGDHGVGGDLEGCPRPQQRLGQRVVDALDDGGADDDPQGGGQARAERARQTTTTPAMATPLPAILVAVSRSPSAAAAIATLMSGADATTMLAGPAGT